METGTFPESASVFSLPQHCTGKKNKTFLHSAPFLLPNIETGLLDLKEETPETTNGFALETPGIKARTLEAA